MFALVLPAIYDGESIAYIAGERVCVRTRQLYRQCLIRWHLESQYFTLCMELLGPIFRKVEGADAFLKCLVVFLIPLILQADTSPHCGLVAANFHTNPR